MGRSGNPAKRAMQASERGEEHVKVLRCVYCGGKTRSKGESTQGARFPHSAVRQTWPPLCAEGAAMRARWAPHRQHLLSQQLFQAILDAPATGSV